MTSPLASPRALARAMRERALRVSIHRTRNYDCVILLWSSRGTIQPFIVVFPGIFHFLKENYTVFHLSTNNFVKSNVHSLKKSQFRAK